MIEIKCDREKIVEYAKKWAFDRNPRYYDFEKLGGDCTNFASQCIFAGCNVMNYSPNGWFYVSSYSRSPSWAGVEFLFDFLTANKGAGPFGKEAEEEEMEIGDLVQLQNDKGVFYHTPVIVGFDGKQPMVAAHSYDAFNRPLSSYVSMGKRFIKILGFRK